MIAFKFKNKKLHENYKDYFEIKALYITHYYSSDDFDK